MNFLQIDDNTREELRRKRQALSESRKKGAQTAKRKREDHEGYLRDRAKSLTQLHWERILAWVEDCKGVGAC